VSLKNIKGSVCPKNLGALRAPFLIEIEGDTINTVIIYGHYEPTFHR